MHEFRIQPQGPFSLAAAQDFAGGFAAGIGGGAATRTSLIMAFPLEPAGSPDGAAVRPASSWRHSGLVELSQDRDDGEVRTRVETAGDPDAALGQALRSVSLDHDGRGWPTVGERDPVLRRLQVDHRFLRPVCFYSAYEAATSFVIGQRIARTQSARIKARLGESYGDELHLEVEVMRHFNAATLFRGRARVSDRLIAEGRFTLALGYRDTQAHAKTASQRSLDSGFHAARRPKERRRHE